MADFDYVKFHTRSFYAPADIGNVKRGQAMACHSKDDEARVKELGFTSANYVPSFWPKTLWNKKTGETKSVGKLEWTKEQNDAAVTSLGPDWTDEHVPVPEAPAPNAKAATSGSPDLMTAILALTQQIGSLNDRMSLIESVIAESPEGPVVTEAAPEAKQAAKTK